jgi:phytoene dehydrogenase-like protein
VAAEESGEPRAGGRIEGGVDAIVVGASLDGLAAAAMIARAGLKTVLLGAGGAALADEPREFWGGYFAVDGEHLVSHLDPELIAALDLYRHGLEYAARRLDSVYFFADGGALLMDGDPYRSRESVVAMAEHDGERFADFLESALDAARALRPLFDGAPAPDLAEPLASAAERFLSASVYDVLDGAFDDEHLKALIAAECLFRFAARPHEPFSFSGLLRRFAGETSGLQGAMAIPAGGILGVQRALRRAAQAARVDLRPATGVSRILVEQDRAAGVETSDGGQIRAPVVVSALAARATFIDRIGPGHLDIGFQAEVDKPAPAVSSARVHFALAALPGDERTRANMGRRLVYAPSRDELAAAYGAARRGGAAGPLILEAVFPSAFEAGLAPPAGSIVSAIAHPIAARAEPDAAFREAVAAAARATFERLAPGAAKRIVATDVRLPADEATAGSVSGAACAAAPGVVEGWARARALEGASGIAGLHFCGPEAQIGRGASGAAGRRAAAAAIRHFKRRPA